jgi:hypothetical protein
MPDPTLLISCVAGTGCDSATIEYATSGLFSHVDAVLDDGRRLGSRSDRVLDLTTGQRVPAGVQVRPADYAYWVRRVDFELSVTTTQKAAYLNFLHAQLGKRYDFPAVLGFAFDRDWRDPDAWYCSELIAAALEKAAIVAPIYSGSNKVTPVAIAQLVSAAGARVAYAASRPALFRHALGYA